MPHSKTHMKSNKHCKNCYYYIFVLAVLCGIAGHLFFHFLAVYGQAFTLTAMTMSD